MAKLLAVLVGVLGCHGNSSMPDAGSPVPLARCGIHVREPLAVPLAANPAAIVAADVDGDPHTDVIVTDIHNGTIAVLLGTGHGDFAAPITSPAGHQPYFLATGDFDHDGKLDVAVTNPNDNQIGVLAGHGDGTFGAPVSYQVGTDPQPIKAADVDGDGWLDLVVANRDDGTVTILTNSAGVFAPTATLAIPTMYGVIGDVQVADLDGDGDVDLLTPGGPGLLAYLNDGHGTFTAGPQTTISGGAGDIALADFDGDGTLDAAVTMDGAPTLAPVGVLTGRGDGSFADVVRYSTQDIQHSITAADLDGDHVIDLITTDNWHASMTVLLGRGDGTFRDPTMLTGAGIYGGGVAVADVDSDSHPDLVVSGFAVPAVTVIYGSEHALPNSPVLWPVGGTPSGGLMTDLDGDGANDILVPNGFPDTNLHAMYGDRAGGGSIVTIPVTNADVVAAGDVTGDGIVDIVAVDMTSGHVQLVAGQGNRAFAAPVVVQTVVAAAAVTLGDLDGDGALDIIVGTDSAVAFVRNTGNGAFEMPVKYDTGFRVASLAVGDLDGDHHIDVIAGEYGAGWSMGSNDTPAAGSDSPGIAIFLGSANGTLATPATLPAGPGKVVVAIGDVDGDGKLDLAATSALADKVAVWHGAGDGTFSGPATYDAGLAPASVELGDVTGDHVPDLVIADHGNSDDYHFTVSILPNQGNGSFGARETHTTSVSPVAALVGDFDGDGHADVAVVNGEDRASSGDIGLGTVMLFLESCQQL